MTLRKSILVALDNVFPLLLPEKALMIDVNCLNSKTITYSELRAELARLESARLIGSLTDQDGIVKYRLTELGRAELYFG